MERSHIRNELDHYIQNKIISSEIPVIVFGAGDYSREIITYLGCKDISVCSVLDNDVRKKGLFCKGVKIVLPDELDSSIISTGVFIVCSFFWREMNAKLISRGVKKDQIITIVLRSFSDRLKDNIADYYHGRKIYKRICNEHPKSKILLCPYTGTGDIYLIGTFLFQYLQNKKILDYVVVVVSKPCAMVADIFSIPNIVQIDGPEACRSLIKYYMVNPFECKITILNDSWGDIYTNPIQWIRGLHGMHFTQMFRHFVFEMDKECKPQHPFFKDVHEQTDKIFKELNLTEGKTVILAPYATTLADMPASFWENVASRLIGQGYDVCTNCGGEDEKEIFGTKRIFFPLNIAPQLIEKAGFFIGIRSGLCDIISGAKAKKIILYDRANFFFNCSAYDYFSLKKMELCDDAIEIEYDNCKISELEELVCQSLGISI